MLRRPRPRARATDGSNPRPLSADGEFQLIADTRQRHPGAAGVGVHRHVAQRLLHRAVETQRDVVGDVAECSRESRTSREKVCWRATASQCEAMRRAQPGVLEDARMERVRHVPDLLGECARHLPQSARLRRDVIAGGRPAPPPGSGRSRAQPVAG